MKAIALELGVDGQLIGRDPREMSPSDLQSIGHQPMSPSEAIRARCIDCCVGSISEVRKCTAVACPSWPYRMGSSPFRKKIELSDDERRARSERLAAARGKKS